jgi:hypothetical protein
VPLHERKCWDCGNVAMHKDNVTPEVLCKVCGSQDTRLTAKPVRFTPTVQQLNDACLTHVHNFGLLDAATQEAYRCHALEWFRVWQKVGVIKEWK